MAFSLLPLLLTDPSVPDDAREAIAAGERAGDPCVTRRERVRAARILRATYALTDADAGELLGLHSLPACPDAGDVGTAR